MAVILLKSKQGTLRKIELPLWIGRDEQEGSYIRISDEHVSKKHCFIAVNKDNTVCIRDFSKNGTTITRNDQQIEVPKDKPIELKENDEINIADVKVYSIVSFEGLEKSGDVNNIIEKVLSKTHYPYQGIGNAFAQTDIPKEYATKISGWKVHVYYTLEEGDEVLIKLLRTLSHLLLKKKLMHKFAKNKGMIDRLEHSQLNQKGKFCTIYFIDTDQLKDMVSLVDKKLAEEGLIADKTVSIFGDRKIPRQISNRLFYRYDKNRKGEYDRPQNAHDYKTVLSELPKNDSDREDPYG